MLILGFVVTMKGEEFFCTIMSIEAWGYCGSFLYRVIKNTVKKRREATEDPR
jgi:hypothetical protein